MMTTGPVEALILALLARVEPTPEAGEAASRLIQRRAPDWERLRQLAVREGLHGLLLANLRKLSLEEAMPAPVQQALREREARTAAWNTIMLEELGALLQASGAEEVPLIVLKGAALLEPVYGSITLRPLEDLDVLVDPGDLGRADGVLRGLGYLADHDPIAAAARKQCPYLNSVRYWKARRPSISVHLHWHIINNSLPMPEGLMNVDMARIWERALPQSVAGESGLIMHPSHALLHHAEHALKHCFSRLILLTDVAELLPGSAAGTEAGVPRPTWDDVFEECSLFGLQRPLFYSLSLCSELLRARVPSEILGRLRPRRMTLGERAVFALTLRDVRLPDMAYPVYAAMVPGLAGRIRFVTRTFFPPRARLSAMDLVPEQQLGARHYARRLAAGMSYGLRLVARAGVALLSKFRHRIRGLFRGQVTN